MQDESGAHVKHASPSTPVRLSGFRELPQAGDELLSVSSEKRAREVNEFRTLQQHALAQAAAKPRRGKRRSSVKVVPAVLKADSVGSLEAVREGLAHFPTDRVELKLVRASVGPLSDADVQLAKSLDAFVVGFNAAPSNKVEALAVREQVPVQTHKVIYRLVEGVKAMLEQAIEPVMEEVEHGTAEVRDVFTLTLNRKDRKAGMSKFTKVAGSRVMTGEVRVSSRVRVARAGEAVYDGTLASLKHFKDEVRTVAKGSECGIILHDFGGVEAGDTITSYEVVARKPALYDAVSDAG
jgi:translation initiation factor IF-2